MSTGSLMLKVHNGQTWPGSLCGLDHSQIKHELCCALGHEHNASYSDGCCLERLARLCRNTLRKMQILSV
jgi:hypothetical protein